MAGSGTREVLVTIPVFNEDGVIFQTVETLDTALELGSRNYRVAIAEDGSTDGTKVKIAELARERTGLIIRTDPIRRGRGFSLQRLWSEVDADIYLFVDADLSTGVEPIAALIRSVEAGADVAIASRYCPGASVIRPPMRMLVSRAYNAMIRTTFRDSIYDHQCGLKAFSRAAIQKLLPLSREPSWFWDTEIVVLASALGLTVREIPIEWRETKYTRTPILRLLSDVYLHGSGYIRLVGTLSKRIQNVEHTVPSPSPNIHLTNDNNGRFEGAVSK